MFCIGPAQWLLTILINSKSFLSCFITYSVFCEKNISYLFKNVTNTFSRHLTTSWIIFIYHPKTVCQHNVRSKILQLSMLKPNINSRKRVLRITVSSTLWNQVIDPDENGTGNAMVFYIFSPFSFHSKTTIILWHFIILDSTLLAITEKGFSLQFSLIHLIEGFISFPFSWAAVCKSCS